MKKKVLELLKSGDFTIVFHDHDSATLHPGKIKYEQTDEESKKYVPSVYEFDDVYENGYASPEVVALVKALGGKVESI